MEEEKETKINNWVEQNKYYGLDHSTANTRVGDYEFDIRYDCCGTLTKKGGIREDIKPDNCGLVLTIQYKGKHMYTKFGSTLIDLKKFSETWLRKEVFDYYNTYCIMYSQGELRFKD